MNDQKIPLDPGRRTHLGILRTELRGRSYEPFFQWEMNSLPDAVEEVLRQGESPTSEVLSRENINRLLDSGYLSTEIGYANLSDGTGYVAVLTEFPNTTGEMIDWWFAWHGLETERYKLWHPQAHLFCQMRHTQTSTSGSDTRKAYLGNTSYVDEYVGPTIHRLAISFQEPEVFGLDENRFEESGVSTAICARVGFSDRPVDTGYVVHLVRETAKGCEMRSRFWIGEPHLRLLPPGNPIDRILSTRFARKRMIPDRLCRDLLVHCAEEMSHLASFLPALFAQECGRP